jgi:hypothetical protein
LRGLLRAWVLVSIVWVLLVCIVGSAHLAEIFTAIEPLPDQGVVSLPLGPRACWIARHPDNPFRQYVMPLAEAWRQCIVYKLRMPAIAAIPPFVVLMFGYLVAWVVRRYR